MHNKDIYDYLANTYISNAKQNRLKRFFFNKKKPYQNPIVLGSIVVSIVFLITALIINRPTRNLKADIVSYNINLPGDVIRLSYDFSPKEYNIDRIGYEVNLNSFDASKFNLITLNARKTIGTKPVSLRVDVENKRREKTTAYINGITDKWKKFSLPLKDFDRITDRSNIDKIVFTAERWNTSLGEDTILIDDLSFKK